MMPIESTFQIGGRGLVITGTIETGSCRNGDEIDLVGYTRKNVRTNITGIETFKKSLDYGEAGDNVGILVKTLTKDDVQRGLKFYFFYLLFMFFIHFLGQLICAPNSQNIFRNMDATIYILKEEEGGRPKPFTSGFRPQVNFIQFLNQLFNYILS